MKINLKLEKKFELPAGWEIIEVTSEHVDLSYYDYGNEYVKQSMNQINMVAVNTKEKKEIKCGPYQESQQEAYEDICWRIDRYIKDQQINRDFEYLMENIG